MRTLKSIAEEVGLPVGEVKRRAARMGVSGYKVNAPLPEPLGENLAHFIAADVQAAPLGQPQTAPQDPIQVVLDRHSARLLAQPGVRGVGIGEDTADAPYILIYTESAPESVANLPQTLDGYPVRAQRVGRIVARKAAAEASRR